MYNIVGKSISELQHDMENKTVTSRQLVLIYLERISKYDKRGIAVDSVAEVNPDALFIADALDRERMIRGSRGPLHGIPVLLKDNINTGDKMRTTAGSVALANNFADNDAPLVRNLRQAGAVILGKANLSEFARYMAVDTVNGYSSLGGQVLNPYDVTKDVSGSSSGSGVAVSCDFCAAAIGTETEGSIVGPSLANGIVGLKPTVGVVSRTGIIPINSQDTAGPMAKSVMDCAIMLSAIAGKDGKEDPATFCTEHLIMEDYTRCLEEDGLKGMRIGVNRGEYKNLTEDKIAIFEEAVECMKAAGAVIIDGCDVPNVYDQFEFGGRPVLLYEFQQALNAYLAHYGNMPDIHTMADVIAYNNEHSKTALKYGQDIFLSAQFKTSGRCTDPEYIDEKLRILNLSRTMGIDKMIEEYRLDVLLCPGYSDLPPIAGYPVINVPAGFTKEHLPYGISFVGQAFAEEKILKAAYGYEQKSKKRRAPDLDKGFNSKG